MPFRSRRKTLRVTRLITVLVFFLFAPAAPADHHEPVCDTWLPLDLEAEFVPLVDLFPGPGFDSNPAMREVVRQMGFESLSDITVPQYRRKCDDGSVVFKGAVGLATGLADNVGPTLASTAQYHVFTVPYWDAGQAYYFTATGGGGLAANADSAPLGYHQTWGQHASGAVLAYPAIVSWRVSGNGEVYLSSSVPTNALSLDGMTMYYTRYVP